MFEQFVRKLIKNYKKPRKLFLFAPDNIDGSKFFWRYMPHFFVFAAFDFVSSVYICIMKIKFLYTPTEILERHPNIRQVWNAQQLGYLFNLKLVAGRKNKHCTLLDEDDVLRIFFFRFPSLGGNPPF